MITLKTPAPSDAQPAPTTRRRQPTDAGIIDLAVTGLDLDQSDALQAYKAVTADSTGDHAIVRAGDVWLLGDHRVACGDSTDPATVARLLRGARPHLMVTDPPYGVEYDANWRNEALRANGTPSDGRAVGAVRNDARADWRDAWRLFPGDVAYVWHADRHAKSVQESLEVCGFDIRNQIIWAKPRFVIGRGNYQRMHEPALYSVRAGNRAHWQGARDQTTLWEISHTRSETGHSTQKPIECMRRPIENNSAEGDAVYEPFLGSGTTLIAAELTRRVCYAVELNPLYVYVSVNRWQLHTGRLARLEETGESFSEVLLRRKDEVPPAPSSSTSVQVIEPALPPTVGFEPTLVEFAEPRVVEPTKPAEVVRIATLAPRRGNLASARLPAALATRLDLRPAPIAAGGWVLPDGPMSLEGVRRICVDLETCDPDLKRLGPGTHRGGYAVGVAVATDDGRAAYYPFRHQGGGNCEWDVQGWLRGSLDAFGGEVVGANITYDLMYLSLLGVTFPRARFLDVLIIAALCDEHRASYSLEAVSQDLLGEGKDEAALREACRALGVDLKNGDAVKGSIWKLPGTAVGPYAQGDVTLPLRLLEKLLPTVQAEGMEQVCSIENRLIPAIAATQMRGIRVDTARVGRVREALVARRDEILAELRRLTSPRLELMAVDSFADDLADRGLPLPLTKTGRKSATQDWLRANAGDAVVDGLIAGRRLNTTINTFIDGHILGHATTDGRIHCQFNQLKGEAGGAISRLSSSNPNLQNVPARDEELGPLVRSLFLPDEGERLHKFDMSQIEYRFLAHYAVGRGSDEARRQYNEDRSTDYHRMVSDMCGIDPEDKLKRKGIKGINFAKGYGASRDKLLRMLLAMGLSGDDANRVYDTYEARLPFAKETYRAADSRARERGFITTILGRRQRFPFWEPRNGQGMVRSREEAAQRWGQGVQRAWTYKALNRLLQGSAADQMKKAMVDIWESGACRAVGPFLVTVHDELDFSADASAAHREALKEIKNIMETCVQLRVPVLCEVESGANWGEMS